jgi:hypothetical protein
MMAGIGDEYIECPPVRRYEVRPLTVAELEAYRSLGVIGPDDVPAGITHTEYGPALVTNLPPGADAPAAVVGGG